MNFEQKDFSDQEIKEANNLFSLNCDFVISVAKLEQLPLTDMPGVSAIVDTLKNDANSSVKIAAIDALRYINRPEYKEEISAVLELSANDQNPYVARTAAVALEHLN